MKSVSQTFVDAWRESAATSALWRALGPIRASWRWTEAFVGGLSRAVDAPSIDRTTERVMAESIAGRALAAALTGLERAWPRSSSLHWLRARVASIDSPGARLCAAAWLTIVAMMTALSVEIAVRRLAPLSWLVPGLVIAAALAVIAVAPRGRA